MKNRPFRIILVCLALLCRNLYAGEVFLITNVGGWHLTLSVVSNQYEFGSQVGASLVISNSTDKLSDFGYYEKRVGSWPTVPNFGKPRISLTGRTNVECHLRYPPAEDRFPILMGKDLNGQLRPSAELRFDFDLSRFWGVKQPGTYQISFGGKIPSIVNPGKEIEYEMGTLTFRIEEPPPSKQTNAPPQSLRER